MSNSDNHALTPQNNTNSSLITTEEFKQNMLSLGLMAEDGRTSTPPVRPNLTTDHVAEIRLMMSLNPPWRMEKHSMRVGKTGLENWALALTPCSYQQAVVLLTRMLAHFPARDVTKDVIITEDLAREMSINQVSLCAIDDTCQRFWKSASKENPWPPASGEILDKAMSRHNKYKQHFEKWRNK